jgi:hypothetical protein
MQVGQRQSDHSWRNIPISPIDTTRSGVQSPDLAGTPTVRVPLRRETASAYKNLYALRNYFVLVISAW